MLNQLFHTNIDIHSENWKYSAKCDVNIHLPACREQEVIVTSDLLSKSFKVSLMITGDAKLTYNLFFLLVLSNIYIQILQWLIYTSYLSFSTRVPKLSYFSNDISVQCWISVISITHLVMNAMNSIMIHITCQSLHSLKSSHLVSI